MNLETVYKGVIKCEYAVRGRVVARAMELEGKGRKMLYCNIGNPQSLGQLPLTFPRQVLSLVTYPALIKEAPSGLFPKDAIARAEKYLSMLPGGSSGSYTHSAGIAEVRQEVANFIKQRDGGIESNENNIFLTDGAGPAASNLTRLLIRSKKDGIMVPVPRYPLYSALLDLCNGSRVDYYLNEANGWQLDENELNRALEDGKARGIHTRALVVVNPGNPTGQVMDKKSMLSVVKFCERNKLALLADEVYQDNVWKEGINFVSFKKIAHEADCKIELASFHSTSKGYFGECGRRGGYVELTNISQDVKDLIYKMASVNLCSNVDGQLMVGLMCNPPKAGEESFELFQTEKKNILKNLKDKAHLVGKMLNQPELGISCAFVEGALYAFPKITLPLKYVKKKHRDGNQLIPPDEAYCLELLNKTGVVLVPGSGKKKKRNDNKTKAMSKKTTILPSILELPPLLQSIVDFHVEFTKANE